MTQSNQQRAGRTALALFLATLALALGACGDSGDDGGGEATPAAQDTQSTEDPQAAEDLTPFLMRNGEEPGFELIGSPETFTGVEAFVDELDLTEADAERLADEGFISFTVQRISGPRTAGVTNVQLNETAEGAKHSMEHELRLPVIEAFGPVEGFERFTVPGIPGARGWTASKPHVANVHWVQGRCFFVLGNQGPGELTGPLSTGARAIYERTNGQCP